MKHSYSELQYEQLAIERFCKVINQIAFVSDVEVQRTGTQKGYGDFIVSTHFNDESVQKFGIEVKSNGEKRFANMFMMTASQHRGGMCCVFMAPYISDRTAELLRENGYSYMDLSGNCYILTDRIFISVSGKPNLYIEKREKNEYFFKSSAAVSAVLRTMLREPDRMWQVKSLAALSGKSLGTVSNVKAFLSDRDWLNEENGLFCIRGIRDLLYAWAQDYHKSDTLLYEYYSLDKLPEIERQISKWSIAHDESALLGSFCSGTRYAPTVRYNRVNVYVEYQSVMEFAADMGLQAVSSGGNVIVTIPHDSTPFMDHRVIRGDLVVSPVQTILDLLGEAGRGEEAADAIILKEFGER